MNTKRGQIMHEQREKRESRRYMKREKGIEREDNGENNIESKRDMKRGGR